MAGYKYKLQNILNLKENIEKDKKNQFGAAMQRLETEKERLTEFEKELSDYKERFADETSAGIPVNQLKLLMDYVEYYKRSISNQKVKIKMAEDYVEECRLELIEASKDKKMLEKLKSVDFQNYQYGEQKKEDKLVDDLVTFKEGKKNID